MRRSTLLAAVAGIHVAVIAGWVLRSAWQVDKVDARGSERLRVGYVAPPGSYMHIPSAESDLSAMPRVRPDAVLAPPPGAALTTSPALRATHEPPPAEDIASPPRPLEDYASFEVPYSDEAKQRQVHGLIEIGLLLDSLGRVREAVVLRGLGYGLDAEARALAYTFRFEPARDRRGNATSARIRWAFRVRAAN